jgi:hypothetical protein
MSTLLTAAERTCERQLILGVSEEVEGVREWDCPDRRHLGEGVSMGAGARATV